MTGWFTITADAGGFEWDFAGGTVGVTVSQMDGGSVWWNTALAATSFAAFGGLDNSVIGADGNSFFPFEITMQIATSGTLIPRFAQEIVDVTASTFDKYSTISAQEISPTPSY